MPEINWSDVPWGVAIAFLILMQFKDSIARWFGRLTGAAVEASVDRREYQQSIDKTRLDHELELEDQKTQYKIQQAYAREERFSDLLRDQLEFMKDEVNRKMQFSNEYIAETTVLLHQAQQDIAAIQKSLEEIKRAITKQENHLAVLTTSIRRSYGND